ncbi:MAG: putative CocE/NonD family hydrolase [Planctomycetota bacterium]|jgi:putative CocE/NonD family hydrolase
MLKNSALVLLFATTGLAAVQDSELRSSFGEYEGYSEERFDGWETSSVYVTMRDDVRLAIDIMRPTKGGELCEEALPLVWTHSRYHRRMFGRTMAQVFPSLQRLLNHGYVVASVAARGTGASFGRYEGLFSEAETDDSFEMIEWFAEQDFCDGNIGMYGGSYLGITQYMAASRAPEALKAIFPDVAGFDMYDLVHPGAIFRRDMMKHWAGLTARLDSNIPASAVDDDPDRFLVERAAEAHEDNWEVLKEYGAGRYRDHDVPTMHWLSHGPTGVLPEINEAKVPAYHCNGWFDVFAMDAVLWFANYEGPQRLVMGNWSHAQMTPERDRVTAIEQHRWFDRYLKGVQNGIDEEAPIQYAIMVHPDYMYWESAETWPPKGTEDITLHFAPGRGAREVSVNDGSLAMHAPKQASKDHYEIDMTTTTGSASRWDNAVGAAPQVQYGKLALNDKKCLTYTTQAFEEDLLVVGHPVVTIWLSAKKGDANLHVLLEEIDGKGGVQYVTEGALRASQRKLAEPPYDNLGLPYQRCFISDAESVPGTHPVEVRMDLHPTATVFNEGNRLRISIMGADADNTVPSHLSRNSIDVYMGPEHGSRIELPILR